MPNMSVITEVIGVLEPENRKVGRSVLTFLGKARSSISSARQDHCKLYDCADNVAVAEIVSEI